jgi:hypothetical protein
VSKSDDNRSSRERAEAVRAAQARKERALSWTLWSTVAVVVLVLGLIVAKQVSGSSTPKKTSPQSSGLASSAVVKAIETLPASVFNSVGVGSAGNPPKKVSGGSSMTADGKPRVLYVGSEFCPYCAAERWGLATALARFGTFTNLGQTTSSSTDVAPDTSTLAFHGTTYTSQYLSFTGYEQQDRTQTKTLDTLTSADQGVFSKLNPRGSIPFVDLGGIYVSSGASYDPGILAGLSHEQIATSLSDPSSVTGQAIIGTANQFTAALCKLTGGMPARVCTSAGVNAATGVLG